MLLYFYNDVTKVFLFEKQFDFNIQRLNSNEMLNNINDFICHSTLVLFSFILNSLDPSSLVYILFLQRTDSSSLHKEFGLTVSFKYVERRRLVNFSRVLAFDEYPSITVLTLCDRSNNYLGFGKTTTLAQPNPRYHVSRFKDGKR